MRVCDVVRLGDFRWGGGTRGESAKTTDSRFKNGNIYIFSMCQNEAHRGYGFDDVYFIGCSIGGRQTQVLGVRPFHFIITRKRVLGRRTSRIGEAHHLLSGPRAATQHAFTRSHNVCFLLVIFILLLSLTLRQPQYSTKITNIYLYISNTNSKRDEKAQNREKKPSSSVLSSSTYYLSCVAWAWIVDPTYYPTSIYIYIKYLYGIVWNGWNWTQLYMYLFWSRGRAKSRTVAVA